MCRFGRFDQEFDHGVFMMGKRLTIATWVFLIIDVFLPLLQKRIEQILPQSLEPRTHPFITHSVSHWG